MKTLIIIDIQNDFLPRGVLAVSGGNEIVPLINELMASYDHVVATQDFHPYNHGSFAANHDGHEVGESINLNGLEQILWPTHCVQGTTGANFAPSLDTRKIDLFFQKGTDPEIDSYSGFFDNLHHKSTGLTDHLRTVGASEVHIVGLATDYCVKFTALDAVSEGFQTTLITDACRGVNLNPGDVEKAIEEMQTAGVTITKSDELLGDTTTLFRPVGPDELALLRLAQFKSWPPRLPDQPIFYPVMNQAYAEEITKNWNIKDSRSGYVTRFKVKRSFLKKYRREVVGGKQHEELWIAAEDLEEMNTNIVGKIEVIKNFESMPLTNK